MQTIYLLCGLLCDETVWENQAQVLRKKGYDVTVMSFQGFDSISGMAAHLLAHAPMRFSLAGHSMGGRVALEAYRQAPKRIERLALLDTGYEPAAEAETESRGRLVRKALSDGIDAIAETWARPMIAPARQQDTALLDSILRMVGRMSGEIYAGQTQALLTRPDATSLLSEIQCPTLILCGKQDAWSPPERHQAMADVIPDSELCLIDDCGHMSTLEQPGEVLSALQAWMLRDPN
ncbi:MAG: alpha/beta hydrolase [Candidatus Thiodiazotropha sp.]